MQIVCLLNTARVYFIHCFIIVFPRKKILLLFLSIFVFIMYLLTMEIIYFILFCLANSWLVIFKTGRNLSFSCLCMLLICLFVYLFRYIQYTLDKYVENDYSVVYFHHGLNSKNRPSISWLVQIYHALDRK